MTVLVTGCAGFIGMHVGLRLLERGERVEYLAAFNNSRVRAIRGKLPTSQPAGHRP